MDRKKEGTMQKSANHHRKHANHHYDLQADLLKIRDAFADTAGDIKGKANDMWTHSWDGLKDKSDQVKESVSDYTAEKPLKSLLIALTVGVVIGYFGGRR